MTLKTRSKRSRKPDDLEEAAKAPLLQRSHQPIPWVVGVGASAGGLEALSAFLAPLPVDIPAIIVIVQHMSHTHRSLLVQLLARETQLPVVEIASGMIPQPGVVHIAPPKHNVILKAGAFELTEPHSGRVPTPSVDTFFLSMADVCGPQAIAIILSGTGSDGAQGLRAVKLGGGSVYVQEPSSAKYDGMPAAAIDTGVTDGVLSADQMGLEIVRRISTGESMPKLPPTLPTTPFTEVLRRVRRRTGVDLESYKENTVERRLARRVAALHLTSLEDYLEHIEKEPEELDRLLQETLISVTAFFRDTASFEVLGKAVESIVDYKRPEEEIRVWVAGCASGEEAYSIAILFAETLALRRNPPRLRIFATDIDLKALQVARRGLYPKAALAKMPAERIQRHFVEIGEGYEVKRAVRDPITFARHDLASDPPFLRADLVCCRNLLIYFQPSLQAKVISLLHYALNLQGYLFLGRSESVSQFEDLFEIVDKAAHLYRSHGQRSAPPATSIISPNLELRAKKATPPTTLADQHQRILLDYYGPPSVLISREGAIAHSSGDLSSFLRFPMGKPDLNIVNVIRRDLATALQTVLLRATRERAEAASNVFQNEDGRHYRITIHPGRDALADYYLLAFVPVPEVLSTAFGAENAKPDSYAGILRDELEATRENLQTVIEELETSNEEMQALNEELQSTNEELQSTNEELETSNEELQSTNEELNTVNDEMQRTGREMAQVNADLLSVLESLNHPVMLLDQRLQLSRYNRAAEKMFRILLHRDGPGLNQLTLPQPLTDLGELLLQTLHNGQTSQRQFSHESQHLVLSVDPCEVPSNSAAGVLVQVHDISSFIKVQKELQTSKERLESVLDNSIMYSVIANHTGRIEFVSKTMADWLGQPKSKLLGSLLWSHFDTRTAKLLRQRHAGAMANDTATEMEEVIPLNRESFRLHSIRVPLFDNDGNAVGVCWKALDISEKERVQQALADSEALSRAVLTAMPAIIAVLDTHGTIVSVNDAWQQFAAENGHHNAAHWVGKNYLDYCETGKENQPDVGGGIRDVLAGRRPLFVHEYPCHSPTQQRWFRMLVAPLRSQAGGAAVMHVDISASVMAQQELQSINASLENRIEIRTRDLKQAVDELEMFSFSVSHDLRSPLRTLIGYSELLSTDYTDKLDDTAREHLGRIVAAARRMSQYLDELLKLSHLTRGELVTTQVEISTLAREIGEEEHLKWPGRRVEFTVAEGLVAKADPNLLRAVLENLIGNAWKYTQDRNPARIDVGQTQFDNQPTFYIRDNGMGFDMSFRDKLFKPFQRLHTNTSIPGSGLGLAVSKRIIVRHGGNIFAEARPGFGATFYFTLPQ